MNDSIRVSRLDFLSIKPYITIKNILIYIFIMVGFKFSDFEGRFLVLATMISITYSSYPFLVGDESGVSDLYKLFGISDKNIVKGRYIYAFSFTFIAFFVSTVLSFIINVFLEKSGEYQEMLLASIFTCIAVIIILCIQMPFYFKYEYKSARAIIYIPLFVVIALGYIFYNLLKYNDKLGEFLEFLARNQNLVAVFVVLFLIIVIFTSIKISTKIYYRK